MKNSLCFFSLLLLQVRKSGTLGHSNRHQRNFSTIITARRRFNNHFKGSQFKPDDKNLESNLSNTFLLLIMRL